MYTVSALRVGFTTFEGNWIAVDDSDGYEYCRIGIRGGTRIPVESQVTIAHERASHICFLLNNDIDRLEGKSHEEKTKG